MVVQRPHCISRLLSHACMDTTFSLLRPASYRHAGWERACAVRPCEQAALQSAGQLSSQVLLQSPLHERRALVRGIKATQRILLVLRRQAAGIGAVWETKDARRNACAPAGQSSVSRPCMPDQ